MTPRDTTPRSDPESPETSGDALPEDPALLPAEAVAAIEAGLTSEEATTPDIGGKVWGEDVSQNPPDDEMEDLPGPSGGQPQESSG